IVVFPGFEVASSEKVHFVCLFDEDTSTDRLNMHLGALGVDPKNPESPVEKTAIAIVDYVAEQSGFTFAAHSTQKNGVLHRRLNNVWQHGRLLAAQIPGAVDALKSVENDFYRKVVLNKDPGYIRKQPMAIINA